MILRLLRLISLSFIALIVAVLMANIFAPRVNVFTYMPATHPTQLERDILAYDTRTHIATRLARDFSILNYDISQDGRYIVYAARFAGETQITLLDILRNEKRDLLRADVYDPAFSPDGQWIAYRNQERRERGIWIMPAQGGEAHRVADLPRPFTWSPDSTRIIYTDSTPTDADNGIFIVDIASGEEELFFTTGIYPITMAWADDDNLILLNTFQLFHYSLNKDELRQFTEFGNIYAHPNLSPDGQQLLAGYAGFNTDAAGIALYTIDGTYQTSFTPHGMRVGSTNPPGVRVGDAVDWWMQ